MARGKTTPTVESVALGPAPWVATVAGFLVLLAGAGTAFAVGIYSGGWSGTVARRAAAIVPYPAAVVDGRWVLVREVLEDTEAFLAYRDAHPEVDGAVDRAAIQSNVLSRLVRTARIERLAQERGIVVTQAEVDGEFARAQADAAATLAEALAQFGWSEEGFKRKVIQVYLLQNKLRGVMGEEALDAALARQDGIVYLMKR